MKQALTRWVIAASVAASVGLAQPGAAGAATTFVDAAAWQAALSGLKLPKAQTMPAIDPHRIIMSDSFGSWTQANQETATATVMVEGQEEFRQRSSSLLSDHLVEYGVRSSEGLLYAGFGCYSPIYPCFGLKVVEVPLPKPILGLAGFLNYYWGYEEYRNYLKDEGFITYLGDLNLLMTYANGSPIRYNGFFGILFDRPIKTLRLAWREDEEHDGGASFRLSGASMIGVPEPSLLVTFAAGVLLVLTAARRTGVARAAFAWRRGRR